MKQIILLISFFIIAFSAYSQSPSKLTYQAIARDGNGNLLQEENLDVGISIHTGTPDGELVWEGFFQVTTNKFGLFTLEICDNGSSAYNFENINWAGNEHFIKVQIDDGTGYREMGTSQILSVPYALHANTVSNSDDADADPNNELIQSASLNGTYLELTDQGGTRQVDLSPLQTGSGTDDQTLSITDHTLIIENGNSVTLPDNDNQALSITDHTIAIENGNSVILPDSIADADSDPQNELLQSALLNGSMLELTDNGGTAQVDLSSLQSGTATDDQILSITDHTLSIENGNSVTLPDNTKDADNDPANEIQDLSLSGNTLSLTLDPTSVDMSSYLDNTDDQTLSLSSNILAIENGNSVSLAAYLDNTDQQGISLSGNTLSISGSSSTADFSKYTNLWTSVTGGIGYSMGNVGIGTTTPSEKLDIAGNVKANYFIGDGSLLSNVGGSTPALSEILATGNSAGAYEINMNNNRIINVDDLFTASGGGSVIRLNNEGNLQFYDASSLVGEMHGYNGAVEIGLDAAMEWKTDLGDYLMGIYGTGDLQVEGNITSLNGTKNFMVSHPVDNSKVIVYACIESGEAGTYFRGEGKLINGEITINLPDHFGMVTSDMHLSANVTPAGNCNGLYVEDISTNYLTVKELNGGESNTRFYFVIYGVRKNYEDFQVIRDK
ncbi:MAG: hypothetical protein K9J25_05825 [Bacteroidales bacterium]|nr:hypothetical protein [Bacteroidales bacterium]